MRLEEKTAQRLIAAKKTLAIAESCTGGLLSHRITNIPGSSKFLKMALVAYSNDAKVKLLKVPRSALYRHGAVSENAALAMAQGARRIFSTDFGVSITGIAGPTGATKTKPVGLTFIAVAASAETLCVQYLFKGPRMRVKQQAADAALKLLLEFLS